MLLLWFLCATAVADFADFAAAASVAPGKTQVGMQLAVDAQIPAAFGGCGGQAVYLDTEGSFMAERCAAMARAVVGHLHRIAAHRATRTAAAGHHGGGSGHELLPAHADALAALGADPEEQMRSFLHGIHVLRLHSHTELLAAVAHLPALLKERSNVKVVVVDSVAFHFRHGAMSVDFGQRHRLLATITHKLNRLAHAQACAVVLVNQMTTKVDNGGDRAGGGGGDGSGGGSRLVPALGEGWAHAATHRVVLFWGPAAHPAAPDEDAATPTAQARYERRAKLIKSASKAATTVRFAVTAQGVRDVGRSSSGGSSSSSSGSKRRAQPPLQHQQHQHQRPPHRHQPKPAPTPPQRTPQTPQPMPPPAPTPPQRTPQTPQPMPPHAQPGSHHIHGTPTHASEMAWSSPPLEYRPPHSQLPSSQMQSQGLGPGLWNNQTQAVSQSQTPPGDGADERAGPCFVPESEAKRNRMCEQGSYGGL